MDDAVDVCILAVKGLGTACVVYSSHVDHWLRVVTVACMFGRHTVVAYQMLCPDTFMTCQCM